jgi:hypothetical protein
MIEESLLKSNYIGKDGFTWWIGQVAHSSVWAEKSEISLEGTKDGVWGARCKVRIVGYHSFDGNILSDDDLPWAQVMLDPSFGSAQGGIGGTLHLKGGETCFGFFLDGDDGQQPVIIGLLYRSDGTKNLQTEDVVTKEKSSKFKPFTGHPGNLIKPSQKDSRASKSFTEAETSPLSQASATNIAFNSDFGFSSSTTTNIATIPQFGDKIAGIKSGIPAASTLSVEKKADITLVRPNGCENNLIGQITQAIQDFIAVTNGLDRYLHTYIDPILNEVVNVGNLVKRTAGQVLGIVKLIINNLRGTIFKCIVTLFRKFVGIFVPPPDQVHFLEAMKVILDKIFCILEKLPASLLNFIENMLSDLIAPINAPACAIEQLTAGILSELMNAIEDALADIISGIEWLTGGLSSITGILNQASSLASQILSFLDCTGLACKTPSVWAAKFGPNEKEADDWQKMVSNVNVLNGLSDGLGSIGAAIGETPIYGGLNGKFNSLFNTCNQKVTNPTTQDDIIPLPPGVRHPNCIPPIVRIIGDGYGASATAIVGANGSIFSIELTSKGSGYTTEPTVMIVDNSGYGSGATARAIINDKYGCIKSIYVEDVGFGYCQGNYSNIVVDTSCGDGTTANTGIGTTANTGIGTTATTQKNISITLSSNKSSVFEGEIFEITARSFNISDGTKIKYQISGIPNDLIGQSFNGEFVINNNVSTITFNANKGKIIDAKVFDLALPDYKKTIQVLIKPIVPAQPAKEKYYLKSTKDIVNEGEVFRISLITENVNDNVVVPYTITGIDATLLVNKQLNSSFTVLNNKSEITFQTNKNVIKENKIFKLKLDNQKASVYVLINYKPNVGVSSSITGCIEDIIITAPGYGYTSGDTITDGKNNYIPIVSPGSGAIVNIQPLNNPICGFDRLPVLTINTRTGVGAQVIPRMKYYPTYVSFSQQLNTRATTVGIVTVIDCI